MILIKLADRLEVMRSLEMFPREKWRKKSWESMNLYAQIAHKLGLYGIKSELEDIALKYLEPKDYEHITTKLEESADERRAFIARFLVPITERLDRIGLKYHVKSRTKSIFSIWSKMHKQHVPFEGVYDIFAIRIIIDCPPEEEKRLCWTVFSVVTDFYTPTPTACATGSRFPSRTATSRCTRPSRPRAAGSRCRSAPNAWTPWPSAVSPRTGATRGSSRGADQRTVAGRLRELMEDTTHSLAQRFDAKPASGEIFVFTPNGDLRKLPEGATLLDFAFDIHTNLGATCSWAAKSTTGPSRSASRCTTATSSRSSHQKNQTPKADWLSFVVTPKARNKIKSLPARGAGQAHAHGPRGARNANSRTGRWPSRSTRRWPTWPNTSRCAPARRSTR